MTEKQANLFGGRTAWARNLAAPVRNFLSIESSGAIVMLAGAIAALLWANSPWFHSYESVWTTRVVIRVGDAGIATDVRQLVNEGLMTLFFLVLGLEARRELDIGSCASDVG
jgi:Na+/H+ antiporter NhaA